MCLSLDVALLIVVALVTMQGYHSDAKHSLYLSIQN